MIPEAERTNMYGEITEAIEKAIKVIESLNEQVKFLEDTVRFYATYGNWKGGMTIWMMWQLPPLTGKWKLRSRVISVAANALAKLWEL